MIRNAEQNKEKIREWLQRRRQAKGPPPPIEQIQVDLGWCPDPQGLVNARGDAARTDRQRKG
jgi:hypothetical protein